MTDKQKDNLMGVVLFILTFGAMFGLVMYSIFIGG